MKYVFGFPSHGFAIRNCKRRTVPLPNVYEEIQGGVIRGFVGKALSKVIDVIITVANYPAYMVFEQGILNFCFITPYNMRGSHHDSTIHAYSVP
jgi:hypothetical protein